MAPEVFAGGTVSPRSDVFGAGRHALDADRRQAARLRRPDASSPTSAPRCRRELEQTHQGRPRDDPRAAGRLDRARSRRRSGRRSAQREGARSRCRVEQPDAPREPDRGRSSRTAAGVFEAAACSIALIDRHDRRARLPVRLGRGRQRDRRRAAARRAPGSAGAVVASGEGQAVPRLPQRSRASPAQIAAGTGYVPHTMVVVPLMRGGAADRRPLGARPPRRRLLQLDRPRARDDVRGAGRDRARREPDLFTSLGEAELSVAGAGAFAR